MSIEEWKGSETYSPNTAYGKTRALTPPPLAPSPPPTQRVVSKWAPIESGHGLAGPGGMSAQCTDSAVLQAWTSWCP